MIGHEREEGKPDGGTPAHIPISTSGAAPIAGLNTQSRSLQRSSDSSRATTSGCATAFWLVSGLAIIGEEQRARDLMERL
jgi:hypothetical protein